MSLPNAFRAFDDYNPTQKHLPYIKKGATIIASYDTYNALFGILKYASICFSHLA